MVFFKSKPTYWKADLLLIQFDKIGQFIQKNSKFFRRKFFFFTVQKE